MASSLTRTIFKNTAFITAGSLALKVINFLFGVFVVHKLGDARFGQYATVLAFVGLFQILAELGVSQYVMREIARDRSQAERLFWNLVSVRALLALAGIGVITWAARLAGYAPHLVTGVFLYTCTFLLAAFSAPLEAILTAHERFDYVTGMTLSAQMTFVTLGAVFLWRGLGYIWLIVASLLSMLLPIAIGVWATRRHGLLTFRPQVRVRLWPHMIRAGLPFGIISLMLQIAASIDTVMLSRLRTDAEVGWYNVAYGLIFSLMFLVRGFKTAIVPSLTRAFVDAPHEVERWYYRSVRYIVLIALPIAAGGMVTAFPLIRLLYGRQFDPAALGLQILIWDLPFLMFASLCGNMTTVIGEERAAARIYTINTVANVALNAMAIPRYGLIGAAFVTVITDFISALQFHFLLRRKLHLPGMGRFLLRVGLAAAGMAGLVRLADGLHVVFLLALGAAAYLLLVLALRIPDASERQFVSRVRYHVSHMAFRGSDE
ncbi:MAG: flippase [Anaerolineales bacterium]